MKNKERKIDYSKEIPFIRKVCAHLSKEELIETENRFVEFIKICFKIQYRIAEDNLNKIEQADFDKDLNED